MSAASALNAPPPHQGATYARRKAFDVAANEISDVSVSSPAQANIFDTSSSPVMLSPSRRSANDNACDTSFTTVGDEGSQQSAVAAASKSRSRVVTASDDDEDDIDDVASKASPRRLSDDEDDEDQLADADDDDDDDDNAIARMRKRLGLKDLESSSLSSAPPTTDAELTSSSNPRAPRKGALFRSSSEDIEDDDDEDGLGPKPRSALGGFASRMKARGGRKALPGLDDDEDEDRDAAAPASTKRLRRAAAPDLSEAEDSSDDRLPSPPEPTHEVNRIAREAQSAAQRAERLRQLAAKRRAETVVSEDEIESDGVLDKDPIADDGEIMDSILTGFQKVDAAKHGHVDRIATSSKEKKRRRSHKEHGAGPKSSKHKSLNKNELEEMDRMTARIQREAAIKRAKAAFQKPQERQTFGITNLLASVTAAEASRAKPQAPPAAADAVASDPIDDAISMDEEEAPDASPSPKKSPVHKARLSFLPPPLALTNAVAGPSAVRLPSNFKQPSSTDDDDLDLPDAGQAAQMALERRDLAVKQEKLRQLKLRALEADQKRKAEASAKKTAAQLLTDVDDDLELELPELKQPQRPLSSRAASTKPLSPVARRTKATPVSMDALRGSLLSKVKAQNLSMRKSSGQTRKSLAADVEESQDTATLLMRLQSKAQAQPADKEEDEEDASDGDYIDGNSAVGSGDEGEVEEDEVMALGSGSEAEARGDESEEEPDDIEEDSDKENSQPQPAPSRRALAEDDDDEDEANLTLSRTGRRRAAIAALSDDDEEGGSESQQRTPLRALHPESSSAADFGKPVAAADGGSPGWSQFFQPTAAPQPSSTRNKQPSPVAQVETSTQQRNEDALGAFFEPTQLETSPSEGTGAALPPTTDTQSKNEDTLGAFFEPTQQSSTVEATARPGLLGVAGESAGFSQFFDEATQPGGAIITSARSNNTAGSMPPPSAFGSRPGHDKAPSHDAFEAIRRAQDREAAMPPMPTMLPSLAYDAEADLDLDDGPATSSSNRLTTPVKAPLLYLNRQGFYTQTRPSVSDALLDSQTQSQSQSQGWGLYAGESAAQEDGQETQGSARASQPVDSPPRRRRRLRRASSPIQSDADEEQEDEAEASEDGASDDDEGVDDERGSRTPSPVSERGAPQSAQPRNAFDVLRRSAAHVANAQSHLAAASKKRTKNSFVEGEAEESEDEDAGPAKRKGRGGLGGVYSESEGSDGGDEDDDEEDDGKDLEGLVDDEREADEADKDALARERFQQDLDEQDAADEALHKKATTGKLRNRKRGRGVEEGDLGNLLDEDFEDEDLMRRAMNLRGGRAQKRQLEGDDGMDALAANPASEAFVREYAETHKNGEDPEAYKFLGGADDGDDDEDEAGDDDNEDDEDDGTERITADQLRKELRERRKAKKMRVDDDDDEEAGQGAEDENKGRDGFSDDDEDMAGIAGQFVDRIQQARKEKERKEKAGLAAAPKRAAATYGRAQQASISSAVDAMDDVEDDEDDEDDDTDMMDQLVMRAYRAKQAINEAERQRLAKLVNDFGAGDSRGSAHARKRGGVGASITSFKAGGGKSMSNSSSSSSLAMPGAANAGSSSSSSLHRAKSGSALGTGLAAGRKRLVGNSASESRLAGLSSVMARQSQFTETQ